uniref:MORN repeat-containing protein n=1 Tax=Trypanosoma vivax (strain Y486) TaxID=1055687 RepID=G0TR76_TRYVY|nr:conserved hypothetical protein, fragment [Trypanosoma vivax Y486]
MVGEEGAEGGNAFTPHGQGTLICVVFIKSNMGSSEKSRTVVSLPYELLVREFGEVHALQDVVLLSICVYNGAFSRGRREGVGRLTVHPQYRTVHCLWAEDQPVLDKSPCLLQYFSDPSAFARGEDYLNSANPHVPQVNGTDESPTTNEADSTASLGPLPQRPETGNTHKGGVYQQYLGMLTLSYYTTNNKSDRPSFVGLFWASFVRFVPHGMGELCDMRGVRYCGLWKKGEKYGFGVEYEPNSASSFTGFGSGSTIYIGGFKYNQREGLGMMQYCKTGVTICGAWKSGKALNLADVTLPSRPFSLHRAQWNSFDECAFRHASLVRCETSLSGVWEPLFAAVDDAVASKEESFLHNDGNGSEKNGDNNVDANNWSDDPSSLVLLISSIMERAEFKNVLMTFQRCFYFLYKRCVSGEQRPDPRLENKRNIDGDLCRGDRGGVIDHILSLPIISKLTQMSHDRCGASSPETRKRNCIWCSPSWCEEVGLSKGGGNPRCFHTPNNTEGLASRMSPTAMFHSAMCDTASFVSSVRLRLFAYVAAHPAAGSLAGSRRVLTVCWDTVYSLVAPVLHDLALSMECEAGISTAIALRRCAHLALNDFVPSVTEAMATADVSGNDEQGALKRLSSVFASPPVHWRRKVQTTNNGSLLDFSSCAGDTSGVRTSEECCEEGDVVYAPPSALLSAFATLHKLAVRTFVDDPLLRERWLIYGIVTMFETYAGEDVSDIVSIISDILESLKRLRYVYPTIRSCSPLSTKLVTLGGHSNGFVYPLDELRTRLRFILLGGATETVMSSFKKCSAEDGNGDGICSFVGGEMRLDAGNSTLLDQCIERALCLPVSEMQEALRKRIVENSIECVFATSGSATSSDEKLQTKQQASPLKMYGNLPSEMLLWIMERVGHALEPVYCYRTSGKSTLGRKGLGPRHINQTASSPLAASISTVETSMCGLGSGTRTDAAPTLSHRWTYFIPNSIRSHVPTASRHRGETVIDSFHAEAVARLITLTENIQFSLLRKLLAHIGIQMELSMRFCYDDEEDSLLLLQPVVRESIGSTQEDKKGSLCILQNVIPISTYTDSLSNTNSPISGDPVCCVGKEAVLTLQLKDNFFGSLLWEVLTDTWIATLNALRAGAVSGHSKSKNAQ